MLALQSLWTAELFACTNYLVNCCSEVLRIGVGEIAPNQSAARRPQNSLDHGDALRIPRFWREFGDIGLSINIHHRVGDV